MILCSVAVPVPALDLLTYVVPDSFEAPAVGARVLVPLGTRRVTGCVVRTETVTASDGEQPDPGGGPGGLREILDVIDDEAFLPPGVVDLASWVAEYYACGPGEAMAAAMPPFAWIESERAVRITEQGSAQLQAHRDGPESALLVALKRGEAIPVRVLAERLAGRAAAPPLHVLIRTCERQGLVETTTALRGRGAAFKTTRVAAITVAGLEALRASGSGAAAAAEGADAADRAVDFSAQAGSPGEPTGRASLAGRRREALEILSGCPEGMRVAALRDRGIGADAVRRLAMKGLVTIRTERVERDPFGSETRQPPESGSRVELGEPEPETASEPGARGLDPDGGRVLTDEQDAALTRLLALADARSFAVALLHGVTGSGKTEVYLRLAGHVLNAGRSVLVLVPEIALTPALAGLFRAAFGDRVAVQHSGLSDGERHDQWHRIRSGAIDVVVGTRSAVFAPLRSIGLIVVDEEHDASYKQEESPRYHGRDVAVVRASREGALVVLGSATPALETYQHALNGRYERLVLTRRVLDRPLATVRVVNMRDEYAAQGPELIFSERLRLAIEERLGRQEQVLVLLNRRGFATAVFCRQCGNTIECPNCSVSLTVHGRHAARARCHYCNYSTIAPKTCPQCAAPYLEQLGIGTERLEQEAAKLFPGARVARLDRDVASRRGATAGVLARFAAGDIDLLIGTQMIAKGHDFPRVTLVGVISADVGLGLPDFRASERTFQLLTQVVGRAGRGERPGEAIIQTLYPEHYSVRLACGQDYPGFFEEEIRFRRSMRYPPHVSLVNAIVRGPSLPTAMADATDLARRVRAAAGSDFHVLGPAPAAFVKLRGEHRVQFFVKGTRRAAMRQAVQAAIAARPELRRKVTIDVDPLTVL